jgi:hypothetical protein
MRNKLAIGVGLVAVVLAIVGPPFVALSARPYEPSLRVGMTEQEVDALMGTEICSLVKGSGGGSGVSRSSGHGSMTVGDEADESRSWVGQHWTTMNIYVDGPDCVGRRRQVSVHFDREGTVTHWETEPLTLTRPPWLDRALKWIGW